jgi:hypothetical protein
MPNQNLVSKRKCICHHKSADAIGMHQNQLRQAQTAARYFGETKRKRAHARALTRGNEWLQSESQIDAMRDGARIVKNVGLSSAD